MNRACNTLTRGLLKITVTVPLTILFQGAEAKKGQNISNEQVYIP